MTPPILTLFRDPARAAAWSVAEWADTVPRLVQAAMASTAAARLADAGVPFERLPVGAARQLRAGAIASEAELRSLRWELGEIRRALQGTGIRVVPLKGADYLLREATPAKGRMVADVDLLIAPADAERAVAAFVAAGWEVSDAPSGKAHEREHHLPVLVHAHRGTQLELHRQVVAAGGVVTFDVARVVADATPQPDGVFALLSPADTTLICVAHFIRNKRFVSAFRDLLDLRELVADFSAADAGFGRTLAARAAAVGLGPALARAVRDSEALFGPLASPDLTAWARSARAAGAGGEAMVLVPDGHTRPPFGIRLGRLGRTFMRLRSSHPRGQTLQAVWALLNGTEDDD